MKKLLSKKRILFLEYLENVRGYSDLTIKSYDASITKALEFIEIISEDEKIVFNLMPYRIHIAPLNAKTISRNLSAIRSFVSYLNDNNIQVTLEADDSVKVAKTLPKPISHKYILQAINGAKLKEKLVVLMLYTLGLRISELASLKLEDMSESWIRVIGKGNKERDVPLLDATKEIIDEYLSSFITKKFLFEKNGEKLSENSLRYMVNKVFRDVSLKVTPHQLRHSYATALLNAGAPIVDVSELLGHSSMATTQIYTKLGSALKQQNYNKAHPLCGVDE
ncbi:MAG TPA: integrase [Sulfurimonas sp.]|nr:MAG: Tyrosine recombinase XerD [uncultured Sulfurimonas sp.]CAI6152467.1 MAG: Tyrosine recombinase XerD [uncultured Sulfurimonas sp.]HIC13291.1 integrase [Sulfurimonas sp.]HIM74928.1 integrase [Campylobacterales bacterium]